MSKAIKGIGRAVSRIVKGIGKGIKKFAKSAIGKAIIMVAAAYFLGPAVGSLLQSAGGAIAAGAEVGSLAASVGNGIASVGSFIGGTGAAAGSGLTGALEAAGSSVATAGSNLVSGVQGMFAGAQGAAPVAEGAGWVSAEGGAGYAGGAAADSSGLISSMAQPGVGGPDASWAPPDMGSQVPGGPDSWAPADAGAALPDLSGAPANTGQLSAQPPQSNIPNLADKFQTQNLGNGLNQTPGIPSQGAELPSNMRGISPQAQSTLGNPIQSTSPQTSRGWLNQIMNDSRAKSALITGGMQLGGGLINGYGQARSAQAAYDRERERVRRNQDVSGLRV